MSRHRAQPLILVVDDDPANRALVSHLLTRSGYDSIAVGDGLAAIRAAADEAPDLVILDVEMPGANGFDVCRTLRADPATIALPIILLTGRTSVEDVVTGLDAGADDFLRKPFDQAELMARIRSVLRLADVTAEVEGAGGVLAALANAVEAKDVKTEMHCQRLASMAHQLAEASGLKGGELRAIIYGALLHDIGKIGVPDAILTKPGPLSPDEWEVMRTHPVIGERICQPLSASRQFGPIVRHHHERWDGRGYPDGLRGEGIPIGARIVGIVDAFDAMTHDRPYRSGRSAEAAIAEIERQRGHHFDPALARTFIEIAEGRAVVEGERLGLRALRLIRTAAAA